MSNIVRRAGLLASAMLLCVCSPALAADEPDSSAQIKAVVDMLAQQQSKHNYTFTDASLAIESWMLTSTAINRSAGKIREGVDSAIWVLDKDGKPTKQRAVLVLTPDEPLDFSQVAMLNFEIQALSDRLEAECKCRSKTFVEGLVPLAGAILGLLKSDTDLTAVTQTTDDKVLAAAVAGTLDNAILPSAALVGSAPSKDHGMVKSFNDLVALADAAQPIYDKLAKSKDETELAKAARIKAVLDRFNAFYARVTTADKNGTVPLAAAAKLEQLLEINPLVLRLKWQKAGGTVVKRTNLLTALGAESVFISGGTVSSYQLTDPVSGRLLRAGVVTCRTTLTPLKRVQNDSWNSYNGKVPQGPVAVCSA